MDTQLWLWIGFAVLVLGCLIVDLGLFQRKAHVVSTKEALAWSTVWIALALLFNAGIWYFKGDKAAIDFLTGYLIEKSLSVDNLFVFLVIFSYFAVPHEYESRVLMWGIFGALVMRAIFILGGIALINKFEWMIFVFGGILILTALKLLIKKDGEVRPERNPVVRLFKRFFGSSDKYDGARFFTVENGKRVATPLFIVVLVIESTDVIFAVDSIPAILAVTRDPFIVYTSNVFAILGLRALYFLLARMMTLFRFLKYALVAILAFVGVKMILSHDAIDIHVPKLISLSVIGGLLAVAMLLSLAFQEKHGQDEKAESAGP